MNNKIVFFLSAALWSTFSLLPVTGSQARIIRKELYAAHANNMLNCSQFITPGLNMHDAVDRDLSIMIEHKNLLQGKIDAHNGYIARAFVPFVNKTGMALFGTIFATSGSFAIAGSDWINRVWNGKTDVRVALADFFVNTGSWLGALDAKGVMQYNEDKIKFLDKENPTFMNMAKCVPVAAAISVISGLLFISSLHAVLTYHSTLRTQVEKIKLRFDRDQAVIAKLKEIKYELETAQRN